MSIYSKHSLKIALEPVLLPLFYWKSFITTFALNHYLLLALYKECKGNHQIQIKSISRSSFIRNVMKIDGLKITSVD